MNFTEEVFVKVNCRYHDILPYIVHLQQRAFYYTATKLLSNLTELAIILYSHLITSLYSNLLNGLKNILLQLVYLTEDSTRVLIFLVLIYSNLPFLGGIE